MRKTNCILISLFFGLMLPGFRMGAQSTVEDILYAVERGNPSLRHAAALLDLSKAGNAAEYRLDDPQTEFNYLWGQNSQVGNRHDLRISQNFDLAALSGTRLRQVAAKDEMARLEYESKRQEILLEAQLTCMDVIRCNAQIEVLGKNLEAASALESATTRKMEIGSSSQIEVNRARLNLSNARSRLAKVRTERERCLDYLRTLTGDESISLDSRIYPDYRLPEDFDVWYRELAQQSPMARYVAKREEVMRGQQKMDRLSAYPSLSVGYMAEVGMAEKYRGVTLGVSVPLWRNNAKLRASAAGVAEAAELKDAFGKQFYGSLRRSYSQAVSLKEIAESCQEVLESSDNRQMLLQAEKQGEVSVLDYVLETEMYCDAVQEYLNAECDFRKALCTLLSVTL